MTVSDTSTHGQVLTGAWSALCVALRTSPVWVSASIALNVIAALAPVLSVRLLKAILDAITGHRPETLLPIAVGLVATTLTSTMVPAALRFVQAHLKREVGLRAQADLYRATERLAGMRRLEDPVFRDRLQLAQQAVRTGPGAVLDGLIGIAKDVLTISGMALVLASISPVIVVVAFLGMAPALAAEIKLTRARAGTQWRISPRLRRELFYAELQTGLAAAMEVRLLGLAGLFRGRMLTELGAANAERRRLDTQEMRVQVGLGLLSAVSFGGGLVWAVAAAGRGQLTAGDVSAFVAAIAALLGGLGALVAKVADSYQALIVHHHYRTILTVEPDLPLAKDPCPVPALHRGIEFSDVWFRYGPDQPWVLRGVNLYIPFGSAVALVGLNGAGKSTVIKLLCRFYDPDRGSIRWDGIDLRAFSVSDLREHIGAVFQDHMEFELSVAENIGVGAVEALDDMRQIQAAAEQAGMDATINNLPRGYRTLLSRMFMDTDGQATHVGQLLSGGQRQRLALARAFMRRRRDLLILDEPSSGLDAAAEYDVHRLLCEQRQQATSVLISHRLNTIRDANRIVVLGDGRVVEEGTHDELVTTGGRYAELFRLQANGYRDTPATAMQSPA